MSHDQEIHVEDLSSEKKYFSQIPNIIHRMGLGCYVVAYYCLLKSIAGDKSCCFMSQKNLANLLGCSDRQIRLMNDFMSKPFEALNGKPLIKITHRRNESGEDLPNLVEIIDIWMENIMAISSKNPIPKTSMADKDKEFKEKIRAEPASGGAEPASGGAERSSYKEEPFTNNPSKKNPLSESSSSEKKNDDACGADDDIEKREIVFTKPNGQQSKLTQTEIYSYFLKKPFSTDIIREAIRRFRDMSYPVSNALKYLESVCATIQKEINYKSEKKETKPINSERPEKIKEKTITFEEFYKCRNKPNPFRSAAS